jgi:hypothetical protein
MRYLILAITFLFTFIAFFSNLPAQNNLNPLNAYFLNSLDFVFNYSPLFLVLFILLIFFYIRFSNFEKKHPKHKIFLFSATQVLFGFLVASLLSFVLLFFTAFLELNFLAYTINLNPKLLGIEKDINIIISSLKSNNMPVKIIAAENNHFQELQAIASATTGNKNFYGTHILPSVPSFIVLPTQKIGSTLLLDNILIITEVNVKDLEKISPVISYIFLKNYFPDRFIKSYPKVLIMNDSEYKIYRIADFNKKIAKINNELSENDKNIGSSSASIEKDKAEITYNQNLVKKNYHQKNQELKECLSKGTYQNGTFIRDNPKEVCQKQTSRYDEIILNANRNLDNLNKQLEYEQSQLERFRYFSGVFKTEIELFKLSTNNVPSELGSLTPPNIIKVAINIKSPHAVIDYFETVIHEYLHYASYSENKTFQTGFFEEGLTEYFARKTINNYLELNTNMGYPLFVKIITEMTNLIPESEFADIYFAQNQEKLEKTLDRVYGESFYKNNLIALETLQFTSDPKQVLKIANDFMKEINGTSLREKDLYSNESSL